MAELVCDICGGKLVMHTGGVAICENCGLEYSTDRLKEKIQGEQIDSCDNTRLIEHYQEEADKAMSSGNFVETESWCDKILELDSRDYHAWFNKGYAIIAQSTNWDVKLVEGSQCFVRSLEGIPAVIREMIVELEKNQLKELSGKILEIWCNNFERINDFDSYQQYVAGRNAIFEAVELFNNGVGEIVISNSEVMHLIGKCACNGLIPRWNEVVLSKYKAEPYPDEDAFREFIELTDFCILLLQDMVECNDATFPERISLYETLVVMQEEEIDACSWKKVSNQEGTMRWSVESELGEEAKELRREKINSYKERIQKLRTLR